jgi:hypothetical protein
MDLTRVGFDQTHNHIKRRRLARAVRPQQSDDLAFTDRYAHTVDDFARFIRFD